MSPGFRPHIRAFWRDSSGAVAVLAPVLTLIVVALAAIAIDASNFYLARRRQQGLTDLAAVAAAGNLADVVRGAKASLTANAVALSQLESVETGTYDADPKRAAALRFVPGTGPAANAVRVTLNSEASGPFASVLSLLSVSIRTRAIAANTTVADLAVTPPLPGLDPAIANGILGGLIGNNLSLSTADYLGLGSVTVDLFALANAVAARSGVSGSYEDLMQATVRLSDVFSALAEVLSNVGAPPLATSALRTLASATSFAGPRLTFGKLLAFESYGKRTVGTTGLISAPVPVLPLITAAARLSIAGASNLVSATMTGLTSGLPALKISFVTNIPQAWSSFAAIGPIGTRLRTLQTRASMTLQLPGLAPLPSLNLALYLQSQAATARLATIQSSADAGRSVTLGITPGLFTAWIGSVPDTSLTDWSTDPQPGYAPLIDTMALKLSASAQSTSGSNSETLMTFSEADITACRMKTLVGSSFLAPLTSLLGSIRFRVDTLGFGFGTQSSVIATATQALQNQMQPIVSTVDGTLTLLGLTTGNVGSWVCAVRAGRASLVN